MTGPPLSATVTALVDQLTALSLSSRVTSTELVLPTVASPVGPLNRTPKTSLVSIVVSLSTVMITVLLVSPAAKLTVPVAAV